MLAPVRPSPVSVTLTAVLLAWVALVLSGCSLRRDSSSSEATASQSAASSVTLKSIAVTPTGSTLYAGASETMTATGTYSNATTQDLTATAAWTSSNVAVATVSTGGVVTAVAPGSATITAQSGTVKGHTAVKVLVTLTAIAVTPPAATLPANVSQALTATGTFDNKATKNLTSTVSWASSNPSVATVSSAGVVTTLAPGTAIVTASSSASSASTVTGSATITVDGATVQSVTVAPVKKNMPKGTSAQLTATATFTDGTKLTLVPPVVSWASSAPSVAAVSMSGKVTALAVGTATITATHVASGMQGTSKITVTAATLTGVAVTPTNPTVIAGGSQPFAATGTYSDGSTLDVTSAVTWSSSAVSVATIASTGLATGVTAGTATITATDQKTGKSGSTALNVTPAVLTSIAITPAAPSLPAGTSVQLTATGTLSDGTQQNVSNSVSWTSSAPAVAYLANAQGLVTGTAPGTTAVTVMDPTTGITASTVVTVTQAVLVSVQVSALSGSLPLGASEPLTAIGTYSDGASTNLTASATWSSSSPAVAVSNAPTSAGVATALALGSATVSATDAATGIGGSMALTVTNAVLRSIQVTPASATIPLGTQQPFTATGRYSDGSSEDLTATATWSSSNGDATVSNAAGSNGVATATAAGVATIAVKDPATGISGSASLTVTPPALVAMVIAPGSATALVGMPQPFIATATYTDGTSQDVSASVTWASTTMGVATIDPSSCGDVVVTGQNPGSTTITATDPTSSVTATALFTVNADAPGTALLRFAFQDPNGVALTPSNFLGAAPVTTTRGVSTTTLYPAPDCAGNYAVLVSTGAVTVGVSGQPAVTALGSIAIPNQVNFSGSVDVTSNVELTIVLPTIEVTVEVVDPTGTALEGAPVQVSASSLECGPRSPLTDCASQGSAYSASDIAGQPAFTGANGTVTLYMLQSSPYDTFAWGSAPASNPTLLPAGGTVNPTTAFGEVALLQGYPVSVTFVDPNGVALTPANASLYGEIYNSTPTPGPTGTFTALAPAGSTLVSIDANSPVGLALPDTFGFSGYLDVPAGGGSYVIPLPAQRETLRVVDPQGNPVAGSQVTRYGYGVTGCGTAPLTYCNIQPALSATGTTGADGSVSFYAFPTSLSQAMATAPASAPTVQSLGWTDIDSTLSTVTLQLPQVPILVTTSADSGPGSLRAVAGSTPPGYAVSFSPSIFGQTITLLSPITLSGVSVQGPGAWGLVISGGNATGLFTTSGTVAISGVMLEAGNSSAFGGAIANTGALTVSGATFAGNTAANGGGAIFNCPGCSLTVNGSTFLSNSTPGGNGGGAILTETGANITGSTFLANTASSYGGAIFSYGRLSVAGSTFQANSTGYEGGAILLDGGTLGLTNSTFYANSAWGGGGSILFYDSSATILGSTFAANGPSIATYGGSGTIQIGTSIVDELAVPYGETPGAIASTGYNLIAVNAGATFTTAAGDQVGVTAGVDAFGDYRSGNATATLMLSSPIGTNPAIAAVPPAYCSLATDQRGQPRPSSLNANGFCDIGAVERQPLDTDTPECIPAPSGIVSWWTGDGTTADARGFNDATPQGAVTYVPGVVGQAMHFAQGAYASAGSLYLPVGSSDRTMEAWVEIDSAYSGNVQGLFVGYGQAGVGGGVSNLMIEGRSTPPGEMGFSQWGQFSGASTSTAPGVWYHIAATTSGGIASFYVNGALVDAVAAGVGTPSGTTTYLGGGFVSDVGLMSLDGAIDEVSIYSRALSPSEIAGIYLAGSSGKCLP